MYTNQNYKNKKYKNEKKQTNEVQMIANGSYS